MTRQTLVFAASTVACVLLHAACGSDAPTNTSPTITAPTPQTPASGSTVTGQTPSLTVVNATGANGLRYRFEVASDSGFSSIVASADNLPEGAGTTSWVVAPALSSGTFPLALAGFRGRGQRSLLQRREFRDRVRFSTPTSRSTIFSCSIRSPTACRSVMSPAASSARQAGSPPTPTPLFDTGSRRPSTASSSST